MFSLSVSSVEQMPTISYLIEKFPINSIILFIVPYNKLVLMQVVRAYFETAKFVKPNYTNMILKLRISNFVEPMFYS